MGAEDQPARRPQLLEAVGDGRRPRRRVRRVELARVAAVVGVHLLRAVLDGAWFIPWPQILWGGERGTRSLIARTIKGVVSTPLA